MRAISEADSPPRLLPIFGKNPRKIVARTATCGLRNDAMLSRYGKLWPFLWANFSLRLLPIFGKNPRKIVAMTATCGLRIEASVFLVMANCGRFRGLAPN